MQENDVQRGETLQGVSSFFLCPVISFYKDPFESSIATLQKTELSLLRMECLHLSRARLMCVPDPWLPGPMINYAAKAADSDGQ